MELTVDTGPMSGRSFFEIKKKGASWKAGKLRNLCVLTRQKIFFPLTVCFMCKRNSVLGKVDILEHGATLWRLVSGLIFVRLTIHSG